jgi:hypothetical protein
MQCWPHMPTDQLRTAARSLWPVVVSMVCVLGGCDSSPDTAPTSDGVARQWTVVADKSPLGMWMSAVLVPDQPPLLVGGQATLGAVASWDGNQEVPQNIPAGSLLTWGHSTADGETLVVGNGRRALWRDMTNTWIQEDLPAGDVLWGCVAHTRSDAWAVGADKSVDAGQRPVLVHKTAAGWAVQTLPTLPAAQQSSQLYKIAA